MKQLIFLLLLCQIPLFGHRMMVLLQDVDPPGDQTYRVLNHYFQEMVFKKIKDHKKISQMIRKAQKEQFSIIIHTYISQNTLHFKMYRQNDQKQYFHHQEPLREGAFSRGIIRIFAFIKLEELKVLDIFEAISRNNINLVKYFIKKGDFKRVNSDGTSPLLHALKEKQIDIAKQLLQAGASPYTPNQTNLTPLHMLAAQQKLPFKQYYSSLFKNINLKNGKTLLHFAALSGDIDRFNFLIKQKISPQAKDKWHKTVFHFAAESGNVAFFKKVITHPALKTPNLKQLSTTKGKKIIHSAVCGGSKEMIQLLLEQGHDIMAKDQHNRSALYYAIKCKQNHLIPSLLKKGLKTTPNDLITAIQYRNIEIIESLGKEKALWNIKHGPQKITATLLAFQYLPLYELKKILVHVPNWKKQRSKDGLSPLHYAILGKKFDTFLFLQQKKIPLNEITQFGANGLYFSMLTQQKRFFLYLIARGVKVEQLFTDGENLLHQAAKIEHLWFFRYLKKRLPNLFYSSPKQKESFLHIAIKNHNIPLIAELLQGAYKVDLFDINGDAPINIAILENNRIAFDLIMKQKPTLNLPNRGGYCPLDIAFLRKNSYMIERLREELAPKCLK